MPNFTLSDEGAEAEFEEALPPQPDKIKVLIINIDNIIDNIFFIFHDLQKFFLKSFT